LIKAGKTGRPAGILDNRTVVSDEHLRLSDSRRRARGGFARWYGRISRPQTTSPNHDKLARTRWRLWPVLLKLAPGVRVVDHIGYRQRAATVLIHREHSHSCRSQRDRDLVAFSARMNDPETHLLANEIVGELAIDSVLPKQRTMDIPTHRLERVSP
jgi:hypothetical protein